MWVKGPKVRENTGLFIVPNSRLVLCFFFLCTFLCCKLYFDLLPLVDIQKDVDAERGGGGGLWFDLVFCFCFVVCALCNSRMNLVVRSGGNGKTWQCGRPCRARISVHDNTFFSNSRLPLATIIEFIYSWSYEALSFKVLTPRRKKDLW